MSSDGAQRYRDEKRRKKELEGYELLRIKKQYQKLLKEEGLDQAQPVATYREPETSAEPNDTDEQASANKKQVKGNKQDSLKTKKGGIAKKNQKPQRTTPFHKLQKQREEEEREKQEKREQEQKEKEETYRAKVAYFKERKAKHQIMSKKTRTGQPVLSNQIDAILSKLKKQ
ncbi:hypothetical protein BC830DRAFT_1080094 [Chytriomyces sp. MP71]|nr:hypothetical protein BC830DRAFT_1080094 [Chytriomyces sp. MP71]